MQEDEKIEEYVIYDDLKERREGNWKAKLEQFLESRYFIILAIILVAITAFALGRISGLQEKREPVRVISGSKGGVFRRGELRGFRICASCGVKKRHQIPLPVVRRRQANFRQK